jgi:hypothetical protein
MRGADARAMGWRFCRRQRVHLTCRHDGTSCTDWPYVKFIQHLCQQMLQSECPLLCDSEIIESRRVTLAAWDEDEKDSHDFREGWLEITGRGPSAGDCLEQLQLPLTQASLQGLATRCL